MQDVRQFGKSMLEQVSDTWGLSSGLKFLCSHNPSLYAIILGLKHAMKLVIFLANVFLIIMWLVSTLSLCVWGCVCFCVKGNFIREL